MHCKRSGVPQIDPLCKPLVGKHLLLLEDLVREAYLELNDCLLVNYACLWPTVVNEELLVIDLDGLTALHIAHEAAEEVVMEIVLLYVVEGGIFVGACPLVLLIGGPKRSDSYCLHLLRRG